MTLDRRQILRSLAASALALRLPCALRASEPQVVVPAYNTLTDDQEIELGRHFAASLEQEIAIVSNPVIDHYLRGIVARVSSVGQRPNLPYSIKLVNTREVNAYSLSGGLLYVNRGLVEFAKHEDELVATISHEVGHVVGRHATNRLLRDFAARRLLETVVNNLGLNNGVIERVIANLGGAVAMLTLLHFSRQDEMQADLLGFYEMLRAGWNPDGFLHLFDRFAAEEREHPSVLGPYLSSHPPSAERAKNIAQELATVRVPTGARTDSISFNAFHLALKLLPEPPKHDDRNSP